MYRTQSRKWLSYLWRIYVYKSNCYCFSGMSLSWFWMLIVLIYEYNSLVDIVCTNHATLPTAKLRTGVQHVSNLWRICQITFNTSTGKLLSNLCQRNTVIISLVYFVTTVKCVPTHDTTFSTTNAPIAAATTPLCCKQIRLLDGYDSKTLFWYDIFAFFICCIPHSLLPLIHVSYSSPPFKSSFMISFTMPTCISY